MANPRLVSMLFPNEPPDNPEMLGNVPISADGGGSLILLDSVPIALVNIEKKENGDYRIYLSMGEDNFGNDECEIYHIKGDVLARAKAEQVSYMQASELVYKGRVAGGKLAVTVSAIDALTVEMVEKALKSVCSTFKLKLIRIEASSPRSRVAEVKDEGKKVIMITRSILLTLETGREKIETKFANELSMLLASNNTGYVSVGRAQYVK